MHNDVFLVEGERSTQPDVTTAFSVTVIWLLALNVKSNKMDRIEWEFL